MTEDDFTDDDKRTASVHDFKSNPVVMGTLEAINPDGAYGKTYNIHTDSGLVVVGSYTALDNKFNQSDLGKKVKIVFKGERKAEKGGRTYMDFDVYVKEK